MEFTESTRDELLKIIDGFQCNNKVLYSNFYGLGSFLTFNVFKGEKSVLIRVPEHNYHRLFVLSADRTELTSILKALDTEYVINIPTRKEVDDWSSLLLECGFEHYATYSHYMNLTVPSMEKRITTTGTFAKPDELQQVYDLLYRSFPPYASHLPDKQELAKMIEGNRVITDYGDDGRICGVNIFTITGTTAYGNAWVDEGERGLEIFFDMFNIFIDSGVKRFVFWIRDGNKSVIKMHKMMGAKPDGLKDYTYVKNIVFDRL